MADLFGADLLVNPTQVDGGGGGGGGVSFGEAKEIPLTGLDEIDVDALPETSAPNLVPKPEDIGQHTTDDGFVNLNAEHFMPQAASSGPTRTMTPTQINEKKRKILSHFDRMTRRGRGPSRRFTMEDSLEDLENEKKAMNSDTNMEFALGAMEKFTIGIATLGEKGAAWAPRAGVRLNGWSNAVNDTMDDFYPVFEEFWDKYGEVMNFGPEMKYLYLMAMSAYTVHMSNAMTQAYGPAAADILKENPEMAKKFAQSFMEKTFAQAQAPAPAPAPAPARPAKDILSEMWSFAGLPGSGPPNRMAGNRAPAPAPAPAPRPAPPPMAGPKNMDDILKGMNVTPPPPVPPRAPAPAPSTPRSILKKPSSERRSVTLDV